MRYLKYRADYILVHLRGKLQYLFKLFVDQTGENHTNLWVTRYVLSSTVCVCRYCVCRCVLLYDLTKYFGTAKHKCLLPSLLVCCKHACVIRALGGVFRVYYAIHNGPVTSTCVLQCRSFPGCIIEIADRLLLPPIIDIWQCASKYVFSWIWRFSRQSITVHWMHCYRQQNHFQCQQTDRYYFHCVSAQTRRIKIWSYCD